MEGEFDRRRLAREGAVKLGLPASMEKDDDERLAELAAEAEAAAAQEQAALAAGAAR
jgi:hypothetical protein